MKKCPACGTENPDEAKYCVKCGAELTPVAASAGVDASSSGFGTPDSKTVSSETGSSSGPLEGEVVSRSASGSGGGGGSKVWIWILVAVGAVLILGVLCCCGLSMLGYIGNS